MRTRLLIATLALASIGTGCKVKPLPADLARCAEVDASVASRITDTIEPKLVPRNFKLVVATADGAPTERSFVSAELMSPEDKRKDRGDIATWIVDSGGTPTSADDHSAKHSTLPAAYPAKRFVHADGFLQSRGCVADKRIKNLLERLD